jgi:hypothetical protein
MMSDAKRTVIEELLQHLAQQEREVADTKRTINTLRRSLGEKPLFEDLTEETVRGQALRPDQFFGKALATAVREYLEVRGQACSAQSILDGLQRGGFDFDALNWQPETRLRSLAMSLAKNTTTFVRLTSSGAYGLRSMYPELSKPRTGRSRNVESGGGDGESESKREK